jgi:hypothetical protein
MASRSQHSIDIVIRLLYRDTSLKKLIGDIDRVRVTSGLLNQTLGRLGRVFGSVLHQFGRATAFYVAFRIFSVIHKAIDSLTDAIPDLIRRGEAWAATLIRIQDATGMAAEEASKLAGVARLIGIDTEKLSRDLSYLGRNVIENEEAFARFGIRVRDSNGELRSSYQIFQSVREAVSGFGRSFLSAAVAQRIFSEGGRDLLRLLTLTGPQFQRLVTEARQAGLIMTQAGLDAARAWERTKYQLDATLTGLGTQILGKVAPVLSALIASISGAIRKNMDQIVDFVSRVVVWIVGTISGLFDLDIKLKGVLSSVLDAGKALSQGRGANINYGKSTDAATRATEKNRNAIERRIDAVDRELKKLDRVEDRQRARREYNGLMRDISDARKSLSQLRNEHLFFSGMSLVEAELARQAHAADIIDGEKALAEAKQALHDWERQQEIEAERDRLQRMRDALQERLSDLSAGTTAAVDAITKGLQGFPKAIKVKGLKDDVLGLSDDLKKLFSDASLGGEKFRKTLQGIQTFLQGLLTIFAAIAQALGINLPTPLEEKIARMNAKVGAQVEERNKAHAAREGLKAPDRGDVGADLWWGARQDDRRGQRAGPATEGMPFRRQPTDAERNAIFGTPHQPGRARAIGDIFGRETGAGGGGGGGGRPDPLAGEKTLRKFFGRSSDNFKNQRAQLDEIGRVGGNTEPLKGELPTRSRVDRWDAGTLGVDNPRYGDIGRVARWDIGEIGTKVHNELGVRERGEPGVHVRNELGVHERGEPGVHVRNEPGVHERGEPWTNIRNEPGVHERGEPWTKVRNRVNADVEGTVGSWIKNDSIGANIRNAILGTSVENEPKVSIPGTVTTDERGKVGARIVGWDSSVHAPVSIVDWVAKAIHGFWDWLKGLFGLRAMGGPVAARTPYVVGERGPELFTPQAAGTVYSNPETRRFLDGRGTTGSLSAAPAMMSVTFQLDAHTTRMLLSGRAVNTTTRAGVGI